MAQVKAINFQLNSSQTRQQGLHNLGQILPSCDEETVLGNVVTWLKCLHQIILQNHESDSTRQLAADNLCLVLKYSSQIPAASREVSSNLAAVMLANLLQNMEEESLPVLSAINAILTNYPTSCGALRSRIVKGLLPLMTSTQEEHRNLAIGCWAQVPLLGGGGVGRSTHAQQWQSQVDQTVQALQFAFNHFTGEGLDDALDPSIGSLSLPFTELTKKEPAVSHTLIRRICTLCECLVNLLDLDFPFAVLVPLQDIMDFILNSLDVSPMQMGNTSEMLLRASFIHQIHTSVLKLFCKLSEICRRNLCRYSSPMNRTFSVLLDLWKDQSPIPGRTRKHNAVRVQIYNAILSWIQMSGATCRFLCGPTHQNQFILNHLRVDITPLKKTLTISSLSESSERSNKAKRRKTSNLRQDSHSGGTIFDPHANAQLCCSALEVLIASIDTMSTRLLPTIHQSLQETVVSVLLRVQQGMDETVPYLSSSNARLSLYRLLLALTLSPSPFLPPPVAMATRIFNSAVSRERDLKIRRFCSGAIASISNIIHPWRTSWHRCTVDISPKTEKPSSNGLMEPMNYLLCQKCGNETSQETDTDFADDGIEEDFVSKATLGNGHKEEENVTVGIDPSSAQGVESVSEVTEQIDDVTMIEATENDSSGEQHTSDDDDDHSGINYDINATDGDQMPQLDQSANDINAAGDNGATVLLANTEEEHAASISVDKNEGVSDDVERMLLDFVDASPDDDD